MPPATCRVSFRDPKGIEHAATVAACSMHEAALLGLVELRAHIWVSAGRAAVVRVEILKPTVCHTIPLRTIERALNRRPRTSEEMIRRNRLRKLWEELMRGYPQWRDA